MRRFERSNALVLALWALGVIGCALAFRHAWVTPIKERDFVALWVAGKLAASGHLTEVFSTEMLREVGSQMIGSKVVKLAYPYPPHALFVAVPLSFLPLTAAYVVWQSLSAGLFYLASRPYLPSGFPGPLALLTPAALINILFGQVGLFYGALWLFAFGGSAIAAACLTLKPHLGLLAGIEVIRRSKIPATVAIFAFLVIASATVFGFESWRAWFAGAADHQLAELSGRASGLWRHQMTTPYLAYGTVGWLAFAAAAIFLLTRRFDVFTAATAAFLISPYGFHYDMTVVCLGFGLLLFQRWRDMPPWQTFICALVFVLPLFVALGTWIASPLLLAGLYVQARNPVVDHGGRTFRGNGKGLATAD